ncbi:MAG: hypothetical protein SVZ03_16370 [Spirochaetota bacterium]|nr:hypothetical protein [Spirochaetota bacterium]
MLYIKATVIIINEPFSFIIILSGYANPFFIDVILRAYAPITISSTPIMPLKEIFSPRIIGEVIRRNAGVKDRNGTVRERGDILSALIYRIRAVSSRGKDTVYTQNNLVSIDGMSSRMANSHSIGIAKNILPKAISIVLILLEYFLVKRSVSDKKKAHRIDNVIQIRSSSYKNVLDNTINMALAQIFVLYLRKRENLICF